MSLMLLLDCGEKSSRWNKEEKGTRSKKEATRMVMLSIWCGRNGRVDGRRVADP